MEWMFITNAWTIFKKSNTIESSMHITTYIKNTPAFVIFEFSPLYNKKLQLKTTSAKKGVLFIYKTVTTNYKNRRQRHLTMKKITIIILTILTIGQTFAQTDKNGNPVFNSVSTAEKSIDNFVLISNYYTLKNNIENTQSSVFISEKPTLDQIEKASINLASDFFIMTKESKMVVMVMADVIMGIVGNIVSGQVTGDTSKLLSDRIGKIMQDRQSLSINRTDTSISKSKQLEAAVPASKIASLSSGEFVGMVADNPDKKIALNAFHAEILNDHQALKSEEERYKPIPLIRQVDNALVQRNYTQIKQEVQEIVQAEIQRMMNDPELESLVVRKENQINSSCF